MKRKNVGQRIREVREEKGMTAVALSKKAGVALASIHSAERGTTYPSFESAARICKVLDISLDWLALAFFDDEEDYEMF